jgi:hypothetical protein
VNPSKISSQEITMKTDAFEADLHQTLARRAAEVPAAAGDRLRQHNYRPRGHSRVTVASTGLVIAALAASGGAYLAGVTTGSTGHVPAGAARLTGATIKLDGYQFALPAGFKATTTSCTPPARGGLEPARPLSGKYAAGAAAQGGCVEAVLSAASLTPPSWASPVQVGHYQGFVMSQPAEHRIALYVDISSTQRYHWLVITAKNLSQAQVIAIAAKALS